MLSFEDIESHPHGPKDQTALISQPKPSTEKSPYFDLADRQKLTIDFRPFIHVEGMDAQEFRQQRIDLAEHTAVILTSRLGGGPLLPHGEGDAF